MNMLHTAAEYHFQLDVAL